MDQELIAYFDGRFAQLRQEFTTGLDGRFAGVRRDFATRLDAAVETVRGEIGVAVEHVDSRIQLLAELVQLQGQQHERHHAEIWTELSTLGQRLTHLQARVLRPPDRGR